MGHGWGLHGGKWKMGRWGQNIVPKTLHVFVGYVSGAWAARASKRALGCLLKLDMFRWVVGFKVLVSRFMFCGMWFLIGKNECWVAIET
jgi:hypothetical protein